ncbi:hypothetical protein C8035_v004839 [Colletotrichum spinosum]|uniref:Ecp2 effector protein domain-containing protein n=1 Tax=Colletotrichum spinosum TaxID=1347390 RepID=A0A4V3HTK5_9PEZI|nr:hypothetical protein C8035_v004839 [Colletotrichum spinosum]
MKFQILPCLALAQLCAAAAIDRTGDAGPGLAPRWDAFRDDFGSNMCLQVRCDTMVCATDVDDAHRVASSELSLIIGPDCAGWREPPVEVAQGTNGKTCADGRKLYSGAFMIWRAWNNVTKKKDYKADFVDWENFKGAYCVGQKDVTCQKDGKTPMAPDPNTGVCAPWGLLPWQG